MNLSKLKDKIKLSLNLVLKLTNIFLRIFDYKVDIAPYSGKVFSILIFYKLSNRRALNFLDDSLICKSKFFDYEIFHQSNDMRAIFPNKWQVDSVSIAILSKASKIFEEKDFYDFGANYGMFSLPYLNDKTIKSHIIVEANPFLITCLKKTFNKNQTIVNKALVGEKEYKSEKVNINIIPCGSGASSIDKEIKSINPFLNYALDVNSTTPSILFKKYSKSKKALLKIDIEQQELNLLKSGLLSNISNYYDEFIIFIELYKSSKEKNIEFLEYFKNYPLLVFGNHNWKGSKEIRKGDKLDGKYINIKSFYKLEEYIGFRNSTLNEMNSADLLVFSNQTLFKEFISNI